MKLGKIVGFFVMSILFGLMTGKVGAVESCMWCGSSCIERDPNVRYNCLSVEPPEGKECLLLNNSCVIKEVVSKVSPVVKPVATGAVGGTTVTCMWCGTNCIVKVPNVRYNCLDVLPPSGQECVVVNNSCVIKEVTGKESPVVKPVITGKVSCFKCQDGTSFGYNLGNANCDSTVDKLDYGFWKNDFMVDKGIGQGNRLGRGDFNCDGKTNMRDFAIWKVGYLVSRFKAVVTSVISPAASGVIKNPTIIPKNTPISTPKILPVITEVVKNPTVTPKIIIPELTPKIIPGVTCVPRPVCLDATVPCKLVEPADGWCPKSIVTTGPIIDVNND
jgi:hypothetical protein